MFHLVMCDIRDMNIYCDVSGHDMMKIFFIDSKKNSGLSIELWFKNINHVTKL